MADRDAEVQSLIRTVAIPSIQKTTLQSICAVQGIPKTGNKADLQKRIVDRKFSFFPRHSAAHVSAFSFTNLTHNRPNHQESSSWPTPNTGSGWRK